MSPERIQGAEYTVRSDVWSLGITLIELALGRFPFSANDDDDDSDMEHPLERVPEGEEDQRDDEAERTLSPSRPENRESTLLKAADRQKEKRASSSSFLALPGSGKSEKRKSVAEKRRSVAFTGVSLAGGGAANSANHQMSILELLQHVVNEPAPKLPSGRFPEEVGDFVDACLWKNVTKRPTPKQLLKHKWLRESTTKEVDLVGWAATIP